MKLTLLDDRVNDMLSFDFTLSAHQSKKALLSIARRVLSFSFSYRGSIEKPFHQAFFCLSKHPTPLTVCSKLNTKIYTLSPSFFIFLLSFFSSFIASKVYLAKMSSGRGNRESGHGEIFTLFDRARLPPKGGCQSGLIEKERERVGSEKDHWLVEWYKRSYLLTVQMALLQPDFNEESITYFLRCFKT